MFEEVEDEGDSAHDIINWDGSAVGSASTGSATGPKRIGRVGFKQ